MDKAEVVGAFDQEDLCVHFIFPFSLLSGFIKWKCSLLWFCCKPINKMFQVKVDKNTLFSQILQFILRDEFQKSVDEVDGGKK